MRIHMRICINVGHIGPMIVTVPVPMAKCVLLWVAAMQRQQVMVRVAHIHSVFHMSSACIRESIITFILCADTHLHDTFSTRLRGHVHTFDQRLSGE